MRKIFILNGAHSDIPLIKAAKDLGFFVITGGNRADLIGHKFGDLHCEVDFSDKDAVLQKAKELEIDAICACANDFGAISAAFVAQNLNLKGHDSFETTLTLHHKDKFKEFAKAHDILTPLAQSFSDKNEALKAKFEHFPLIVKPIDLTGGKGVSKLESKKELESAINLAFALSRQKKIIIEPFIEGSYHSFSSFLVGKKVILSFSDNEYSYKNAFLVSSSASPADKIDLIKPTLIAQAEKIANLLDLKDGVFHMQYILQNNKPFIIEITRRMSGDFYSEVVEYALKVPWSRFIVAAEAGFDCANFKAQFSPQEPKFCGRHCIMADRNGIIKSVEISPKIQKNIYKKFLWWKKGDKIENFMVDKLGILFLKFNSREEMLNTVPNLNELVRVKFL